jgi:2-dehydropantoate 2-reductase
MRNPGAAATGRGGNDNDRDPLTRWLAIRIGAEAIKVGLAHGYALEPIYHIPPERLLAAGEGDRAAREECEGILLEQVKHRNDEQRPSMGQDIIKGRRTEIDYINGLVAAKGAELKIATPANSGIVEVVRRIERGEIAPGPETVAHI